MKTPHIVNLLSSNPKVFMQRKRNTRQVQVLAVNDDKVIMDITFHTAELCGLRYNDTSYTITVKGSGFCPMHHIKECLEHKLGFELEFFKI